MCIICGDNTAQNAITTLVAKFENRSIAIKHVPCLRCEKCGIEYYTGEVGERLEKIIKFANMQELDVVDYDDERI